MMLNPVRCIGRPLVLALTLLLCACNNTYGPPPANGKPQNWGQQHYLDVERNRELNQNRMR